MPKTKYLLTNLVTKNIDKDKIQTKYKIKYNLKSAVITVTPETHLPSSIYIVCKLTLKLSNATPVISNWG